MDAVERCSSTLDNATSSETLAVPWLVALCHNVHNKRLELFFKASDAGRVLFCVNEVHDTMILESIIRNCKEKDEVVGTNMLQSFLDSVTGKYARFGTLASDHTTPSKGKEVVEELPSASSSHDGTNECLHGDPVYTRLSDEERQAWDNIRH